LDGGGTAGIVIDQSSVPGTPGAYFDTGNEYADDVNQKMVASASTLEPTAEHRKVSVLRDTFLNNTTALSR